MSDKVTDIIKRTGCRLVHLLSGDRMTVPLPAFKRAPLTVGQAIDPEAYRTKVKRMEDGLALEQAGRMLMIRDLSQFEIRTKLLDVGYTEETADRTIDKLIRARLVDDGRYVVNYINAKMKRVGAGRIRRDLIQKGIPAEDITAALEQIDTSVQLEAAVKHAKRALAKKTDDPWHQERLAFAALARKGYSPDIIRSALHSARLALEEQEADGLSS